MVQKIDLIFFQGLVKISVKSPQSKSVIPQAQVKINGQTYKTNDNGNLQFKVKNCTLLNLRISKDGFSSHDIAGRFFVPHTFVIELEPKIQMQHVEFE